MEIEEGEEIGRGYGEREKDEIVKSGFEEMRRIGKEMRERKEKIMGI